MEAQCPECDKWSDVEDLSPMFIFSMWAWAENGGADCPNCGHVVLFESECEFRKGVKDEE